MHQNLKTTQISADFYRLWTGQNSGLSWTGSVLFLLLSQLELNSSYMLGFRPPPPPWPIDCRRKLAALLSYLWPVRAACSAGISGVSEELRLTDGMKKLLPDLRSWQFSRFSLQPAAAGQQVKERLKIPQESNILNKNDIIYFWQVTIIKNK